MPPVLGPRSPSKTGLWSWALARGMICLPSVKARNEASSPSRNSSITTWEPAAPEGVAGEHVGHGRFRLVPGPGDHDPLAGGQAVRLDHDRRPDLLDEVQCRLHFGEDLVGGGRNAVLLHDILGKRLARLNEGGILAGAEDLQVVILEQVDNAEGKREFRVRPR